MGPATAIYYGWSQSPIPEVKKSYEDVSNVVSGTVKGVGDFFGGVANTVNGAINAVKKYWYVPVIIGGVVIGYKLLNTSQSTKLLAALAAKK